MSRTINGIDSKLLCFKYLGIRFASPCPSGERFTNANDSRTTALYLADISWFMTMNRTSLVSVSELEA